MADIDIEKKNPTWPWILLAVVVAAILLIIFIEDSPEPAVAEDEPIETTVGADEFGEDNLIDKEEDISAVEDYVTFIGEDADRLGYAHNYTHDALVKLIDAIEAMASGTDYDLEANLSEVRDIANDITTEPLSEQHGNKLTEAFRILTNALMELQQAHYPALEDEVSAMDEDVSRLEEIASSLNPDELTLEQKEIINSYFNQAAEVLKMMN